MRRTRTKKFKYSFLLKHLGYVMASIFLILCFYFGVYKYEHENQNKKQKEKTSISKHSI